MLLNPKKVKDDLEKKYYRFDQGNNTRGRIGVEDWISPTIFDHLCEKYINNPRKRGVLGALAKMAGIEAS